MKSRALSNPSVKRLLAAFLCLSLVLLVSCASKTAVEEETEPEIVGSIGGEDITRDELEFFKGRVKSKVMAENGGAAPEEELNARALAEAQKARLVLIECKKAGIFDDISWNGLKAEAEKYNAEHKDGAVGLTSIDMDSFYLYYVENGKLELENRMKTGDIDAYIEKLYDSELLDQQ